MRRIAISAMLRVSSVARPSSKAIFQRQSKTRLIVHSMMASVETTIRTYISTRGISTVVKTWALICPMTNEYSMFFRNVLQCAPIITEGFSENTTTELDYYTRYWYGASITASTNFTYEVENLYAQYIRQGNNRLAAWATDPGLRYVIHIQIEHTEIVLST